MVRATLDDIAAKTGSSRSTVARLMASLRKANVVRLEHGGRWMLNPAVVFKGAQPPNECADSLSSDGTTRASLGARRERAEGCLMPIIEMVLPGERNSNQSTWPRFTESPSSAGMALHVPIWRPKQR